MHAGGSYPGWGLLELFGGRRKKGKASSPFLSLWCMEFYEIRLGAGPRRQCLWPPASLPAAGARRLVGPTSYRTIGRQAGPTAWRSCRGLVIVALPLMTRALSR